MPFDLPASATQYPYYVAQMPTADWLSSSSTIEAAPSLPAPRGAQSWSTSDAMLERSRVIEKLALLSARAVDWDGYGGVPASRDAVRAASAFLSRLPHQTMDPEVELAGDGEITLVWRGLETYLEIGFYDRTGFSYFGRMVGVAPIGDDVQAGENQLPPELCGFLNQFSHADMRLRAA